jgi:hypothetical protein
MAAPGAASQERLAQRFQSELERLDGVVTMLRTTTSQVTGLARALLRVASSQRPLARSV